MKKTIIFPLLTALLALNSCELLSPDEVQNPNVEASDFATSPQAMQVWVNGTNANFAVAVATFAEYTGLLSDDLLNNSSRSSKTYDQLDIHYTDNEVFKLSTHVGKMLQMTDFGLHTIAVNDAATTPVHLFSLHYIRAYAYLLGGENFVALPREARGEVLDGPRLLEEALAELQATEPLALSAEHKALVALLEARALRGLGRMAEAEAEARSSLANAADLVQCVQFDALNGFNNSLHEYIAGGLFTIAPQLSAQQAKFPMADYWNQPLSIAKSEEAYLILAEAAAADNRFEEARQHLLSLLQLATERPASVTIVECETSAIEDATNRLSMLELIYDLRQQVLFGEGRRASDMGIRLPISEVEFNEQGNLPSSYKEPVIPAYLQSIRSEVDKHTDISRLLVNTLY